MSASFRSNNIRLCELVMSASFRSNNFKLHSTPVYFLPPHITFCKTDFKYICYVIGFLVGARFSALVQTGPEAQPGSYTVGTESLVGIKRPGRGVNHPPSSSDKIQQNSRAIQLLPLCALMAVYRVNYSLYITHSVHFIDAKCDVKIFTVLN
jgi:hypothetical protein